MAPDVAYDDDGALTPECRKMLTSKRAALRRKIILWETRAKELSELPTLTEISDLVKAILEFDAYLNDDGDEAATNESNMFDDKIRSIKASILGTTSPSPVKGIVERESIETTASKSPSLSFTHHWTIENFAHLYDEACQWNWSVQSEVFAVPENESLKFILSIWPKMKGGDGEEYLKVALITKEMPDMWEGKVTVKERMCIVDEEGNKLWGKGYEEREVFNDEYLPVERLLDSSARYLKSGILRVLSEMTLRSPEAIFNSPSNTQTFSHTSIPSSVSSLSHSLTLSHFKWLCEDSTRIMPLRVESDFFAPQREGIGRVRILFCPKGDEGDDEENAGIVIRNQNTDSLNVYYEFSLLDAKGDKRLQYEDTCRIHSNTGKYHSVPRRSLLSLLDTLPTDELTINCHVTVLGKGEVQEKAPPTTPTSTTHLDFALFNFHYVSFTWTIEQFLSQLTRNTIDSKFFSPSTDSRYNFSMRLYPNKGKENVSLSLGFISTFSIEESKVHCRFSIVDAKEEEWNIRVRTHLLSKPAEFGPNEFLPHRTLANFASLLLPEGMLTIKCELWIDEPRKELPLELLNPPQANDSGAVPQVHISHSTFTSSLFASQSTVTTGDINNTLSSTSAETSEPK